MCVCACVRVRSRCLTDILVIALMPEPIPAGTYIDELEAENQAAVPVLRQLAHDPRFERAWPLWRRYVTTVGGEIETDRPLIVTIVAADRSSGWRGACPTRRSP